MHYLIEQNKIHVDFRIDETGKTLLCPHWYSENTKGTYKKANALYTWSGRHREHARADVKPL